MGLAVISTNRVSKSKEFRNKHNEEQRSAYQLNVMYGDETIGVLSLDSSTHLLKLAYFANWQQGGFASSFYIFGELHN